MTEDNTPGPNWYHGAQQRVTVLRAGSSVTRYLPVAIAFSHRPTVVSYEDNGRIRHDGSAHGFIHCVDEPLGPDDLCLHPACQRSGTDWEWVTQRDLALRILFEVDPDPDDHLYPDDIAGLQGRGTH
jgi:hypothetical protein